MVIGERDNTADRVTLDHVIVLEERSEQKVLFDMFFELRITR